MGSESLHVVNSLDQLILVIARQVELQLVLLLLSLDELVEGSISLLELVEALRSLLATKSHPVFLQEVDDVLVIILLLLEMLLDFSCVYSLHSTSTTSWEVLWGHGAVNLTAAEHRCLCKLLEEG